MMIKKRSSLKKVAQLVLRTTLRRESNKEKGIDRMSLKLNPDFTKQRTC